MCNSHNLKKQGKDLVIKLQLQLEMKWFQVSCYLLTLSKVQCRNQTTFDYQYINAYYVISFSMVE